MRDEWAPDTLLAEVQAVWGTVVGERIAAAATPISERAGVLTVLCTQSAWAQELELLSDSIRTRLNERVARGSITRIRCRVGG